MGGWGEKEKKKEKERKNEWAFREMAYEDSDWGSDNPQIGEVTIGEVQSLAQGQCQTVSEQ